MGYLNFIIGFFKPNTYREQHLEFFGFFLENLLVKRIKKIGLFYF